MPVTVRTGDEQHSSVSFSRAVDRLPSEVHIFSGDLSLLYRTQDV